LIFAHAFSKTGPQIAELPGAGCPNVGKLKAG